MSNLPEGRRPCAIIHFSKLERGRFLSHLDLARVMDRAVRRAKLPVAYTEGFHPHAEISFGPPLPLGVEGLREPCCLNLAHVPALEDMTRSLSRQLPGCLPLVDAEITHRGRRSPLADYQWAGWEFTLADPEEAALVADAATRFLAEPEWLRERQTKSQLTTINLRAGVGELAIRDDATLLAQLSVNPDCLAKPEEILQVLAEIAGLPKLRVQRTVRSYLRLND
ncbi:MAG TPA: TIGR03936 family radical SAM-associated protein [Armatimonadota bacterium]|jgi:radical SAM-linked protein